ncbi:MAG TPA: hypothetical protein VLV31_08110 [Candidatus Acidoferrales bacterium]|nr:hypothetical protein [Candidatus Acidoferrales bacterium]
MKALLMLLFGLLLFSSVFGVSYAAPSQKAIYLGSISNSSQYPQNFTIGHAVVRVFTYPNSQQTAVAFYSLNQNQRLLILKYVPNTLGATPAYTHVYETTVASLSLTAFQSGESSYNSTCCLTYPYAFYLLTTA